MNKKSKNYRMILYFAFVVVFFITLYFSLNKNAYITFTSLKDERSISSPFLFLVMILYSK